MLTSQKPPFEEALNWFQFTYTVDRAGAYVAPAYMVLAQSDIADGGKLFPVILSHLHILYLEVYVPAVSLGWAPARREFPLGYYGEGLSCSNIIINSLSKLGAYTGKFDNIIPIIERMNNPSPSLTNVYLDTPPVGLTPDPLEYAPPPPLGRLGKTYSYPQTSIVGVLHTSASKISLSPPPPPSRTHPRMHPPTGQAQLRRVGQKIVQVVNGGDSCQFFCRRDWKGLTPPHAHIRA